MCKEKAFLSLLQTYNYVARCFLRIFEKFQCVQKHKVHVIVIPWVVQNYNECIMQLLYTIDISVTLASSEILCAKIEKYGTVLCIEKKCV